MILHLPFDDPDGSIAYDFSQYRNDATLSDGADFSKKSKVGKSLALNGTGECETARSIPFSGNFTLCFWVLPVSQKLGWVLNMPGIDNYKEQWLDVMPMAGFSLLSLSPAICLPSMRTRPGYSVKYYQRHQRGFPSTTNHFLGRKPCWTK